MTHALLRPPAVRKLAALLRPLPVRERTTILAQAIHEGTLSRVGADQVLFALAWTATTTDTRSVAPHLKDKRSATASAIVNEPLTTRAQHAAPVSMTWSATRWHTR